MTDSATQSNFDSVLVIEDEEGMAEVLSLNLRSAGLAVEVIRDGISALARLDNPPPEAVVLDLGLPEVSGYRVMRVLRNTPGWEETPVVVATAYNFEEAADVIRDGVDEFMTKPFDMDDLVRRVVGVIGARRLTRTKSAGGERACLDDSAEVE